MYYMNYRGQRTFFLTLRRGERNIINSYVGTTWLADDKNGQPLLLNGNYNFLVLYLHQNREVDVIITSKRKLLLLRRRYMVVRTPSIPIVS